jgi:transcriptional regulator with XRE-family HTH domain
VDQLGPQARRLGQRRSGVEPFDLAAGGLELDLHLAQQMGLLVGRDVQGAARRHQRMFGEAHGRGLIERAAGPRERTHHGRPIAFHEHRRRAASRVVARLALTLEQHDTAALREAPGQGSAGDPRADDDNVKFPHLRILSCENHAMGSGKTSRNNEAEAALPDRVRVGARLREIRKGQRLTLKSLSQRSGVALSTLSKMELGQISASYEKLAAVARALAVDIAQLFGAAPSAEVDSGAIVVRSVLKSAPRYDTDNYDLRMLATTFPAKRMTPAWGRVDARRLEEFNDFVRHPGQEFVMVLSGTVRIQFETGEAITLKRQESAYFDSGVGHVYLSTSRKPAELVVVMSPG